MNQGQSAGLRVSWDEAAEIVGCSVPTIDWHTRTGRIKTRAHHGNRPTLDAASLEDFREWWEAREDARQEERRQPAPRRPRKEGEATAHERPEPAEDWLSIAEACELLGKSESTVRHHIRRGELEVARQGRLVWLAARSVREYAQDRKGRISATDAAKLAGCSRGAIAKAVAAGKIIQRPVPNRAVPSLELASVKAFKTERDEHKRRRAERLAIQEEKVGPPQGGAVWLSTSVVAALLGVSSSWIRELAREGRLPHHTSDSGRRFFRRDHVELVSAARVAATAGTDAPSLVRGHTGVPGCPAE